MGDAREGLDAAAAERLTRYLAGTMTPGERIEFERAALDDDRLAEALYGHAALADAAAARRSRWTLTPALRVALPLAAVLIAVFAVTRQRPDTTVRGVAGAVRALAPVGDGPEPTAFRWTRVDGALHYRLEVTDTALRPIVVTITADTFVAVAPDDTLASLRAGVWTVTPIDSAGRELRSSGAIRFRAR
jgi:hypothetical protein